MSYVTLHRSLVLCVLAGLACACTSASQPPADWAPFGDSALSYRLTLDSIGLRTRIRVDLRWAWTEARTGAVVFDLPDRWGGQQDLGNDLYDWRVRDGRGRDLPFERDAGTITIDAAGATSLRVSYGVRPQAHAFERGTRFRAVGAPDLFVAYGRNLFALPRDRGDASIDLELATSLDQTVWATTLAGVGERLRLSGLEPAQALDAAYAAGSGYVWAPDAETTLFLACDAAGLADVLASQTRRLTAYTEQLYGPTPRRGTVGLVVARSDHPAAATGSGRPGGFVLEVGERAGEDTAALAELVAHEHLHRYIGFGLRFDSAEAVDTLWFKEGLVTYLAADAVARAGLADGSWWLARLSRALTAYRAQSRGAAPPSSDEEAYWDDDQRRRQPYEVGFLLAFWLDWQLRQRGDRLDRAVGDLLRERAGGPPLRAAELASYWADRLGDGRAAELIALGRGDEPLPVDDWLSEAGLVWREVREPAPYYGVRTAWTPGGWRILSVDPSGPAAAASLRAGQRLLEPPRIPRQGQSRAAQLVVRRRGSATTVTIHPLPGERVTLAVDDPQGRFLSAIGLSP